MGEYEPKVYIGHKYDYFETEINTFHREVGNDRDQLLKKQNLSDGERERLKKMDGYQLYQWKSWHIQKLVRFQQSLNVESRGSRSGDVIHVYFTYQRDVTFQQQKYLQPPWVKYAQEHWLPVHTFISGPGINQDAFFDVQGSFRAFPDFNQMCLMETAQPIWQSIIDQILKICKEGKIVIFSYNEKYTSPWLAYFHKHISHQNFFTLVHLKDNSCLLYTSHDQIQKEQFQQYTQCSAVYLDIMSEKRFLYGDVGPKEEIKTDGKAITDILFANKIRAVEKLLEQSNPFGDKITAVQAQIEKLGVKQEDMNVYQKEWDEWFENKAESHPDIGHYNWKVDCPVMEKLMYCQYLHWKDKNLQEWSRLSETLKRLKNIEYTVLTVHINVPHVSETGKRRVWMDALETNHVERVCSIWMYDDTYKSSRPEKSTHVFHCAPCPIPFAFEKVNDCANILFEIIGQLRSEIQSATRHHSVFIEQSMVDWWFMSYYSLCTCIYWNSTNHTQYIHSNNHYPSENLWTEFIQDGVSTTQWGKMYPNRAWEALDKDEQKKCTQVLSLQKYLYPVNYPFLSHYPLDYDLKSENVQSMLRLVSPGRLRLVEKKQDMMHKKEEVASMKRLYLECKELVDMREKCVDLQRMKYDLLNINTNEYDIISMEAYYSHYPQTEAFSVYDRPAEKPNWVEHAESELSLRVLRIVCTNDPFTFAHYDMTNTCVYTFCIPDLFCDYTVRQRNECAVRVIFFPLIRKWLQKRKNVVFTWQPQDKDSKLLFHLKQEFENPLLAVIQASEKHGREHWATRDKFVLDHLALGRDQNDFVHEYLGNSELGGDQNVVTRVTKINEWDRMDQLSGEDAYKCVIGTVSTKRTVNTTPTTLKNSVKNILPKPSKKKESSYSFNFIDSSDDDSSNNDKEKADPNEGDNMSFGWGDFSRGKNGFLGYEFDLGNEGDSDKEDGQSSKASFHSEEIHDVIKDVEQLIHQEDRLVVGAVPSADASRAKVGTDSVGTDSVDTDSVDTDSVDTDSVDTHDVENVARPPEEINPFMVISLVQNCSCAQN